MATLRAKASRGKKKARVISFHCVLRDRFGHVISSSFNNEVVISKEGRSKAALDGLIRRLGDVRKGEKRQLNVGADEAYGYYDRELVLEMPRRKFPEGSLQIGANVLAESGVGQRRLYRIVALSSTHVTLDGNHPLAGQDLVFDIEAIDVRDATPAEVEKARDASAVEQASPGASGGASSAVSSSSGRVDSGRRPGLGPDGTPGYLH